MENKLVPVKTEKPDRAPKLQKISQGDCVETPDGGRGIVMLVNPMGDCYVEVQGKPIVYLAEDLVKLPIAIVSPDLSLHQIYLEQYAYKTAYEQAKAMGSVDCERLKKAWELREKLWNAATSETFLVDCILP